MKPILQSTAAECGRASLAMVADFHGLRMDLADLRQRFSLSFKGFMLERLMRNLNVVGQSSPSQRLHEQHIGAYSKPQSLKPGMGVVSDIIQRKGKL